MGMDKRVKKITRTRKNTKMVLTAETPDIEKEMRKIISDSPIVRSSTEKHSSSKTIDSSKTVDSSKTIDSSSETFIPPPPQTMRYRDLRKNKEITPKTSNPPDIELQQILKSIELQMLLEHHGIDAKKADDIERDMIARFLEKSGGAKKVQR